MPDMCIIVSEPEFRRKLEEKLRDIVRPDCVTGPGRSGAIASVYASHYLGVPFLPYGTVIPDKFKSLLVIDTAQHTGKTLRRAMVHYHEHGVRAIAIYNEPPRVKFWYEPKEERR